MFNQLRKAVSVAILAAFISTSVKAPAYADQALDQITRLPAPGIMVHLSHEFIPAHLQGITIHPDNALQFDFLINKGDDNLEGDQRKEEYKRLVKYFLASLTIPDEDQWVNLSPFEKDRIIKVDFGKTEMGRDLLAEDYMLKQITSSLIYPEDDLGRKFWDKIYERAWKEFHTINIPVNTFNKVWIVPDQAVVYESGNTAYILQSHLKVMLEEDYLSLEKHSGVGDRTNSNGTHTIGSQVIREIILPALEKEINEGWNFANLRQIYSGMILAAWYKKRLKESLFGKAYVDKAKVKGVNQDDPKANEAIYQRYLQAFKKGVYNYIKEDFDEHKQQIIPRKYFSGGFSLRPDMLTIVHTGDAVDQSMVANTLKDLFKRKIDKVLVFLGALTLLGTSNALAQNQGLIQKPSELLPEAPQVNQIASEYKAGEFMSPQDIDTLLAKLNPPNARLNDIYSKVDYLNNSIEPFQLFVRYIKKYGTDLINADLIPEGFVNYSDSDFVKLNGTEKGKSFKRVILKLLPVRDFQLGTNGKFTLPPFSTATFNSPNYSTIAPKVKSPSNSTNLGPFSIQKGKVLLPLPGGATLSYGKGARIPSEQNLNGTKNNNKGGGLNLSIPLGKKSREAAGKKQTKDHSMLVTPGGIDLNSSNLNLKIKQDGKGMPLPLQFQDLSKLQYIEGFEPMIINITPLGSLPLLSELKNKLP